MKIQIQDTKREECCTGHKMLACEEMRAGIRTVCCSFFGVMYTCATIILDDTMRATFERRSYLDTTPYVLRMLLCTCIVFLCMYAATSVLVGRNVPIPVFLKLFVAAEALRLFSYSWDVISLMTSTYFDMFITPVMIVLIRLGAELAFAALVYRSVLKASRPETAQHQQGQQGPMPTPAHSAHPSFESSAA